MKGWKTFMAMMDLLTDASAFLEEARVFLYKKRTSE